MTTSEKKTAFEKNQKPSENVLLQFKGLEGFDVYNCSIPFTWKGRRYIYGRVEKRHEWARSWVRLFEETEKDTFVLSRNSMIYQLEDPFIAIIKGELVLGGTYVRYRRNQYYTFFTCFYRGTDLEDLRYFTSGPDFMKDIRLVELPQGIGVFSRPRNENVEKQYGSASVIGFTVIPDLDSLCPECIDSAAVIPGLFGKGEWGGCNQCYLLDSGYIGVIGHKSYHSPQNADPASASTLSLDSTAFLHSSNPHNPMTPPSGLAVYINISFVFDPARNRILDEKILAVRSSYPPGPAKKPELADCTFTSGLVPREDGKADLYGGLGDVAEGRIVIDYPFQGYGNICKVF
ncbi:MAG: DUF1861 family protein [Spirochaetaceae bacterium]|jgi:hypothetical protein|nr:DUF1861 family protein [Spirochaetaceae bacterium]